MPLKKTPTPSPAAALISQARKAFVTEDPSDTAVGELAAILKHNDASTSHRERVGADAVVEMLRGLGWKGAARGALNSLCVRKFGRRSFGTP